MPFKKRSVTAVSFIIFLSMFTFSSFVFAGDTLTATHDCSGYVPGVVLTVTTHIEYTGSLTALGIQVSLPKRWSFVSVYSCLEPDIKPATGSSGTLGFAWIETPESPFVLSYTISVPENESGEKEIRSKILYRRLGNELQESVTPDPLILSR